MSDITDTIWRLKYAHGHRVINVDQRKVAASLIFQIQFSFNFAFCKPICDSYMDHQYTGWYDRLKTKYPIVTEEEWQMLDKITKVKVIKKGESFLSYGKLALYAAFIVSGQFAFAIIDDEGNEKFVRFAFADDLLSNCESYYRLAPSAIRIFALEDSVIKRINLNRLRPLYDVHMCISTVNLQIYQEIIEQNVEHQYILSLKSPVKRYRFLLEKRPNLLRKISLTNIARYLYISREALSRARLSVLTNNR